MQRIIKIFLATSSDLKPERELIEKAIIARFEKEKSVFELMFWDDDPDKTLRRSLHVTYHKAISESDIFVMIFTSRIPQYAEEEFQVAFSQRKDNNKPHILAYFKESEVYPKEPKSKEQEINLLKFKNKLSDLGYPWVVYRNHDDLLVHFSRQLDHLIKLNQSSASLSEASAVEYIPPSAAPRPKASPGAPPPPPSARAGSRAAARASAPPPPQQPPPRPQTPAQSSSAKPQQQPEVNYWLLKIRAQTWDIPGFRKGQDTWFNTYTLRSEKRPEYETLQAVRPGDKVIAYAYERYNAVVGTLTVTEGIHADEGKGEVISMIIDELFPVPLQLDNLSADIEFADQLDIPTEWRWRGISEAQYHAITQGTPRKNEEVLPSYTTEGNHLETEDQLAFTYDIESFSTIMVLKDVKPPLAIGLFGNWGSGKSFFMEKLKARINKKKGSNKRYVDKVVQVTFNSWHYSDANLWASLITEIFEELYVFSTNEGKQGELEKLSKTLQITTLQKEATEQRKKELESKKVVLEAEQKKKREELKDISGLKLLKHILKDPYIQQDLKSVDNDNIQSIINSRDKIASYIKAVQDEKNKSKYFWSTLWNFKGPWIYIAFAVIILAVVAFAFNGLPFLKLTWDDVTGKIASMVLLVTTAVGKIVAAAAPIRKRFNDAYNRLTSLMHTIDSREVPDAPELSQVEQELASVKSSLESIDQQINATRQELADIRTGRKLMQFIENRSRDEQYSRQLGLISWIRKDFKRLDDLLRLQYDISDDEEKKAINPENITLKIDRIILYIDDLDRCNEDTVVKVLEAVHLLLAFPLFVVVVGVDPRWLNKSLSAKYPFFTEADREGNGQADHAVSSFDYLEKIFQIPFTLKPITKTGREDLLAYLLKNEIQSQQQSTANVTQAVQVNTSDTHSGNTSGPVPTGTTTGTSAGQANAAHTTVQASGQQSQNTVDDPISEEVLQKNLTFTTGELSFMQEVSALFGHTPRTIKRFVNIYRLIKTHGNFVPGLDYKPTLLVLAIVVGCPHHARSFVQELSKNTKSEIYNLNNLLTETDNLKELEAWLKERISQKIYSEMTIESLRQNLELISRFSFRTISR
ncbi:MAG TPA: P-loop NTPase fold protein [Chitinophagaceae bacterium]|nr:P-loop NTPase fold protein [Chitinophagaceae bacterium]